MRLYGKKISSHLELNLYRTGEWKCILNYGCECKKGDGILLFDRYSRLSCVLEVVNVEKAERGENNYYIEVSVLNPEVQELSLSYFGYTRLHGLQFIGYSSHCRKLKLKPKK